MEINRASASWLDTTHSIDERVALLLEQMTLDEKIAQLGSYWIYQLLDNQTFSPEKAAALLGMGVGHITRLGGASNVRPVRSARICAPQALRLPPPIRLILCARTPVDSSAAIPCAKP